MNGDGSSDAVLLPLLLIRCLVPGATLVVIFHRQKYVSQTFFNSGETYDPRQPDAIPRRDRVASFSSVNVF